ncbi:MAG: EAL domain-containing protein [Gammaproteobacteria bacterium]|nr:EAL domain-containing protein [Gammaproteobacteria bacterium]
MRSASHQTSASAATPVQARGVNEFENSLDCYGNLVRMLIPRARIVALYAAGGDSLWASANGHDTGTLDGLVADRLGAPVDPGDECLGFGCQLTLDGGDTAYLAPLADPNGVLMGVLALVVPETASASRPYSFIHGLIQPVLQCLERDLQFQRQLGALSRSNDSPERDLELLADLSENDSADKDPAGALMRLADRCLEHFHAEICAIIVPDKGLKIMRGRTGAEFFGKDVLARTQRNLLAMAQLHGKPFTANRLPKARDGSGPQPKLPFKILSCPIHDRVNGVQGILALFGAPDAPDFQDHQARILSLLTRRAAMLLHAGHDELTGALTLGAFREVVARAAGRDANAHSVLFINVDSMHVVNDRFGLEAGDEVLVRVADLARETVKPKGSLCRLPGDQFALLLPDTELEQARDVAEKLLGLAAQLSFLRDDQVIQVSLSIGAALVPVSTQPAEQALAAAEVACRMAKDHGRGRVECYQEDDQSIIRRQTDITMLGQLNQALTDNEFVLFAQPIQCTRTGRLHGFEILLRMRDEKGETLAPDRFLSAAQRYNLMPAIDRWVLDNTLQRLGPYARQIEALDLQVFINLSGQSLGERGFSDFLLDRITDAELPAERLCFEITESAAIAKLGLARELIERVRKLGGQFALDDFGTGLSSFAYLQSLPVSMVKIDGGFVRELAESRASTSMVTAIVQVARVMQLRTVAEYVENDLIRRRVAALGVDYSQGFLIGRPQALDDTLSALPSGRPAPPVQAPEDEEIVLSSEEIILSSDEPMSVERPGSAAG